METDRRTTESAHRYDDVQELLRRLAAAEQAIQDFEARQSQAAPEADARPYPDSAWRESEGRFQLLADTAPIFVWIADRQGGMVYFNRPWLDFTGRSLDQERGQGWLERVHPDDRGRWLAAFRAAGAQQADLRLEFRLLRADGQYRWMVASGVPRRTGEEWNGYIGTAFDFTDRRNVEVALRSSRDQLSVILQGAADGITAQAPDGRLIYANDAAARLVGYESSQALLAARPAELALRVRMYDEKGRLLPFDQLPGRRALQTGANAAATIRYRLDDRGEERWSYVRAAPIFDADGSVEMVVNLFHDVTELKRAELSQRLLADAGDVLAASLDSNERMTGLARLPVPLLADWCIVHLVEDGRPRQVAAVHGNPGRVAQAEAFRQQSETAWLSALGVAQALRRGASEYYPDLKLADARAESWAEDGWQFIKALGFRSLITVPLLAHERVLGAITIIWAETDCHYGLADVALAESLAQRVALAVENARLFEAEQRARAEAQRLNADLEQRVARRTAQLQDANARLEDSREHLRRLSSYLQAAREDERARIAREIHDDLGQTLSGLKMDAAWLRKQLEKSQPVLALKVRSMARLIDSTVQRVRRISTDLRPGILDDLGLLPAVEWQLQTFQTHSGLECTLETELDSVDLDPQSATALFRVFQETLSNVARHAQAKRVMVKLAARDGFLMLEVRDDGQGITEDEIARPKSFGLVGMRERIQLLGGELHLEGQPGHGTTVTARLPLRASRSRPAGAGQGQAMPAGSD